MFKRKGTKLRRLMNTGERARPLLQKAAARNGWIIFEDVREGRMRRRLETLFQRRIDESAVVSVSQGDFCWQNTYFAALDEYAAGS